MFRGRSFQYSAVRVQAEVSSKPSKRAPLLLRGRKQRLAAIYPSVVLAIGAAAASIAVIGLGMLG